MVGRRILRPPVKDALVTGSGLRVRFLGIPRRVIKSVFNGIPGCVLRNPVGATGVSPNQCVLNRTQPKAPKP